MVNLNDFKQQMTKPPAKAAATKPAVTKPGVVKPVVNKPAVNKPPAKPLVNKPAARSTVKPTIKMNQPPKSAAEPVSVPESEPEYTGDMEEEEEFFFRGSPQVAVKQPRSQYLDEEAQVDGNGEEEEEQEEEPTPEDKEFIDDRDEEEMSEAVDQHEEEEEEGDEEVSVDTSQFNQTSEQRKKKQRLLVQPGDEEDDPFAYDKSTIDIVNQDKSGKPKKPSWYCGKKNFFDIVYKDRAGCEFAELPPKSGYHKAIDKAYTHYKDNVFGPVYSQWERKQEPKAAPAPQPVERAEPEQVPMNANVICNDPDMLRLGRGFIDKTIDYLQSLKELFPEQH
jgi:hypothetical protein